MRHGVMLRTGFESPVTGCVSGDSQTTFGWTRHPGFANVLENSQVSQEQVHDPHLNSRREFSLVSPFTSSLEANSRKPEKVRPAVVADRTGRCEFSTGHRSATASGLGIPGIYQPSTER